MHGTVRLFPVFILPIVWNICEHLHYESANFKELHNEQEYYQLTIYRAGAAVVSTITSCYLSFSKCEELLNAESQHINIDLTINLQ